MRQETTSLAQIFIIKIRLRTGIIVSTLNTVCANLIVGQKYNINSKKDKNENNNYSASSAFSSIVLSTTALALTSSTAF